MPLRIAILCCFICCLAGRAQVDQDQPAPPSKDTAKTGGNKTDGPKLVPAKTDRPKASSPKSGTAPPPAPAQPAAQKILDALDAALHEHAGQRADIDALMAKKAQLQSSLNVNADPADVARQATEQLAALYLPAAQTPPVPAPDTQAAAGRTPIDYIVVAIFVSLLSPLICVAGFWWGTRVAENGMRRGLREAGLL
jgi:hypothetical protein